jgi:hypothetical protein
MADGIETHDKFTIISMAVIAAGAAVLLHEGLGHGVTAWLRGDGVLELTSNHLSAQTPDRLVDAGGTIANLIVGVGALVEMRLIGNSPKGRAGGYANSRYFLWLLAALNLLPAAGYFMLSGIFNFGDWAEVIRGWPNAYALRIGMTLMGGVGYYFFVRLLAIRIRPFVPEEKVYNTVSRLPYYAAGIFSCLAGLFDPLGIKLLLISTIPAAFGGSSGMMWGDSLMPRAVPEFVLTVKRQPAWFVAAIVLGGCYIFFLGRGIHFAH